MSAADWVFLLVGMVIAGIVAYVGAVLTAEVADKIARRWGHGK